MKASYRGTFVISWSQTEVDGLEAAPVQALTTGAAWSWRGDAVQVDGPAGILRLDRADGSETLRKRAARMVHRLVGAAMDPALPVSLEDRPDAALADNSFVVTDGAQSYTVTMISVGGGAQPLLMFLDELPPRRTDLWVVHHTMGARLAPAENEPDGSGVICFTPGTRISTPWGQKPVETLRVGDLVQTRDNGAQKIEWIGSRHMTGARLFAMPRLRPVRIRTGAFGVERPDQELLVSPEHRMLVSGPVARELFNTPEVLVAARDLMDSRYISTDTHVRNVTYIHLLLSGHNILWANGVMTESFHPANTALTSLSAEDRARLLGQYPDLAFDPHTYGGYARRNLSASEAAILRQAA